MIQLGVIRTAARDFPFALIGGITLLATVAHTVAEPPSAPYSAQPVANRFSTPAVDPGMRPLPINLPTALQLAGTQPLDILAASERLRVAEGQLREAKVLWLPSIQFGIDYYRHDGPIQSSAGDVSNTSKGAFFAGMGPNAVFAVADAIYAPLAAKQVVRSRQFDVQAAANDSLLSVAEAYQNVQQARGELAGAIEATHRTEELVRRTQKLAEGLVPPLEAVRVEAELARRQQTELTARERWRSASTDLVRVLRLDPTTQIDPIEPPHLRISLLPLNQPVDDLITLALTNRPELASQQAIVQAALQRLKQERIRPLVPSVLIRGAATNPTGTFSTGVFGGGLNGSLGDSGLRNDIDFQLVWQLNNLGLGNRAKVQERRAEQHITMLDLFRTQDRVAAETAQAFAQAQIAEQRIILAERGLRLSIESADKNLIALGETKRSGELIVTVVRPQEAVASVQALGQAYTDYFGAIADFNRAQFRLYRATGQPAQSIISAAQSSAPPISLQIK